MCIFTKALAVEIVENFSSQAVLTALGKHIARRNFPHTIYSDQGTQFVKVWDILLTGCHKAEFRALSHAQTAALERKWPQITWNLVPPGAHHRVGSIESMVKMVKQSLQYIAVSRLTKLEFDLTVQKIAAVINNRPLAFNLSSEQVISPNQILLGRAFSDSLPPEGNEPASIAMMSYNTKAIVQSWFE